MTGYSYERDWGSVDKCPYCPLTNIKRAAASQITCGGAECRRKHNLVAQKASRDRAKRRARKVGQK